MSSTFDVVLTPCVLMYQSPRLALVCALISSSEPRWPAAPRLELSAISKLRARIWSISSTMLSFVVYGSASFVNTSSSFATTASASASMRATVMLRIALHSAGYAGASVSMSARETVCAAWMYRLRHASTAGRHDSTFCAMKPWKTCELVKPGSSRPRNASISLVRLVLNAGSAKLGCVATTACLSSLKMSWHSPYRRSSARDASKRSL